jgi:membrane protein YdbS with pleckstrin-like domain
MTDTPAPRDILAQFDPKVKVYLWLQVAVILAATGVGLLALPFWLVLGPIWANLYFPTIEARLSERSLVYRHGVWFRQEMSIPLDKIQDVSLHTGPILNALGLSTLKVDTAGGGQAGSSAVLVGVVGSERFRGEVIRRRDQIAAGAKGGGNDELAVLKEIRDSLQRLEGLLSSRS